MIYTFDINKLSSPAHLYTLVFLSLYTGNFVIKITGEVRAGDSNQPAGRSVHHQSATGYLCEVINHDGTNLGYIYICTYVASYVAIYE